MFDRTLRGIRDNSTAANWICLGVGGVLVAVLRPLTRGDLLVATGWMNSSILVPRWLFGVALLVGTAIGLAGLFALSRRTRTGQERSSYERYRNDELEGVHWSWDWRTDVLTPGVDIATLTGSCSVCETKLHEVRSYTEGVQRVALRCGSCEENRCTLPMGMRFIDRFLNQVGREIERRALSL